MMKEMNEYVVSCSVCAQRNVLHQFLSGKLHTLATLESQWSERYTMILIMISSTVNLMALPALPTALETAMLLFQHVFRYYGLPENIVNDRGLQFMVQVWRGFMVMLGITVSLTSGYNPQASGQIINREIVVNLLTYCNNNQGERSISPNSLWHSATNITPFQWAFNHPFCQDHDPCNTQCHHHTIHPAYILHQVKVN